MNFVDYEFCFLLFNYTTIVTENESFLWTAAAQQARGNTTCHICLKTFACNSALEIHYRR